MNDTPTYCNGSSKRSPKNIIADIDSNNALNPSHATYF